MKPFLLISTLAATSLLAACGQKAETPVAISSNEATSAAASMKGDMSNMAMEPSATSPIKAKGHGIVTAIDKAAGTITLNHGAIPEAKWPAMTMAFKASPAILQTATVGETVNFDLTLVGSTGEVTALSKQN
ncbi:copper-binding protein [Sphingomonas sp. YL-JM2C]